MEIVVARILIMMMQDNANFVLKLFLGVLIAMMTKLVHNVMIVKTENW